MEYEISDLIKNFPEHAERALDITVHVSDEYKKFDKIVFMGMGGSGIGGNIMEERLRDNCPVPIIIIKDYELPGCVDSDSLVFLVSYSGNTHETLACFDQAVKRGCKIIGIASGGQLAEILERNKIPLIRVPSGMPPRASLPYLFFPIANVLSFIGLKKRDDCVKAVRIMKRYRRVIEKAAKEISSEIVNTIPFIYGSFESVCMRFKRDLNENSKVHAKYEVFPELNHNEIVGWQSKEKTKISLIILNDNMPLMKKYVSFLRFAVKNRAKLIEIFSKGDSKTEKMFYFIYLGGLISYYLAKNNKEDPADISNIDNFKKVLDS